MARRRGHRERPGAAGALHQSETKAKRPLDTTATRELISDYLTWQLVVNAEDSILAALDLEERHQISFWDALVVHAAQTAGADVLYSEDLSDGQMYGSVRVVNPLLGDRSAA